jgi:hypothetical protein
MARAAKTVLAAGALMLLLGARVAARGSDSSQGQPLISAGTFVDLWLGLTAVAAVLLVAYLAIARRRLRHYERQAGFLPREGRKELPRGGRQTLVRLEFGSSGGWVCMMITRWDHDRAGWHRRRVLEHVWERSDDAVAIGEQRALLSARAEALEEDFEDARLAGEGEHELAGERDADRIAETSHSRRLAETLARDR